MKKNRILLGGEFKSKEQVKGEGKNGKEINVIDDHAKESNNLESRNLIKRMNFKIQRSEILNLNPKMK